jgi:hypothetical protein
MTPKDRQRVIELVSAAAANKAPVEATVRAIHQEMPNLTAAELKEVCLVTREESRLDAAVYKADAEAADFIVNVLEETGQDNVIGALEELILRSEQGGQHAAEELERFVQALGVFGISEPTSQ